MSSIGLISHYITGNTGEANRVIIGKITPASFYENT